MKLAILQRILLGFVLVIAVIVLNFMLLAGRRRAMWSTRCWPRPVAAIPNWPPSCANPMVWTNPSTSSLLKYLGRVLSGDSGPFVLL